RKASICSVTFMDPSSAVMPEATLPPTRMAVSTGPSSRRIASATTGPTYASAPKRAMLMALWRAKTMPVKIAAVMATPSDCTPMISVSRTIRRKYAGGRARLRATCAVSSPMPPDQVAVRLKYVSMPSFHPEALDHVPEILAARRERRGGRDVQEVVDTAVGLHHVGVDADTRPLVAVLAFEKQVDRRPAADGHLVSFDHGA